MRNKPLTIPHNSLGDNMNMKLNNKGVLDYWFDLAESKLGEDADEMEIAKWRYEHGHMRISEWEEYLARTWEPSQLDTLFTEGINNIPSLKYGYNHLSSVLNMSEDIIATHDTMDGFRKAVEERFSENGNCFNCYYYWYDPGKGRLEKSYVTVFWNGTLKLNGYHSVKWSRKLKSLSSWSHFKYELLLDAYSKGQTGLVLKSHEDYDEVMFMRAVEQNKEIVKAIGEDIKSYPLSKILEMFLPEHDKQNHNCFTGNSGINPNNIRKEIADRVLDICLNEDNIRGLIGESKEESDRLKQKLEKLGFTINFRNPVSTIAMQRLIRSVKEEMDYVGLTQLEIVWGETCIDDEYMEHYVSYRSNNPGAYVTHK